MPDRTIKMRRLKEILRRFGISFDPSHGKGSHGSFVQCGVNGFLSYTVPDRDDVLRPYVRGCRKKFKLTAEDGVSDRDFYDD